MTVYFIKPIGFEGPIKIGCSDMPQAREDALAIWSPFPLEVVAEVPGGFQMERRFHALFRDTHLRSEWFEATPDLLSTIQCIRAGEFDTSSLPEGRNLPTRRSPNQGRKWSEHSKAAVRRNNAMRRIAKKTGLHLTFPYTNEQADAFIANPSAETGGISKEEMNARYLKARADDLRKEAEAYLARAEEAEKAAA